MRLYHIVNSVFTSRTYILIGDNSSECWIVDCGDVPPIIELLTSQLGDSFDLKGVLLTHVHYDHIYGLPRLTEFFPSIKVYTNDIGKKALANPRLNMSKYHDDPIVYESDDVVTCGDNDMIDLFDGIQAQIYETPGHHPSCLTFEVGDYLFTGDAFIPGEKVVTILPGADRELAISSLEKIKKMSQNKIICPGHEVKTD